jgi:hypothetical protein
MSIFVVIQLHTHLFTRCLQPMKSGVIRLFPYVSFSIDSWLVLMFCFSFVNSKVLLQMMILFEKI